MLHSWHLCKIPNSQYNLPAIGTKIAYQANRAGVAARFADPAVHKSIEVDLALITYDDALLGDVERTIVNTARHHDAHTLSLLAHRARHRHDSQPRAARRHPCYQPLSQGAGRGLLWPPGHMCPGIGRETLGHVRPHDRQGPSHMGLFCSCRLVPERPSAAQQYLTRLEKKHDKGQALTVLAQQLARAVSHRLTRQVACERETCFQRSGRGVGEPGASLDNDGLNLQDALDPAEPTASLNAKARRGRDTLSPALGLDIRSRSCLRRR